MLGGLSEETAFVAFAECGVDCDADVMLGCGWLRAHDLNLLYDSDDVCIFAERGCTPDRRVRLDLTPPRPPGPRIRWPDWCTRSRR